MTKFKILLLQNHWANVNQTWHKASLGEWDSVLFKEEPFNSHQDNNVFFLLLINVMIYWFELFSQVSDVAHGPLVFIFLQLFPVWKKHAFDLITLLFTLIKNTLFQDEWKLAQWFRRKRHLKIFCLFLLFCFYTIIWKKNIGSLNHNV